MGYDMNASIMSELSFKRLLVASFLIYLSSTASPARRAGIPLRMGTLLAEDSDGHDDSGYVSSGPAYPDFALPKMEEHDIVVHGPEDSENVPPEAHDADWVAYDESRSNSMSRRRLTSNLPALRVQVNLPPPPAHLFPASAASNDSPGYYQSAFQHKSYLSAEPASEGQPVTPLEQIFTTPDHPPELRRDIKRPAHFSQSFTQQELPEGVQYGVPAPPSALEGSMYKGYRQPAPSNFSSPYASPYPSPTAQYFARHGGSPGMNFEDALHQAAPPTYHLRHMMPHLPRHSSYQAPRSATHSTYQPMGPYGYSPTHQSPLSVSYNGMPGPSSQPMEPYLPVSRAADETEGHERTRGHFARAFGAMELQSPVAIRPFFVGQGADGSSSGPLGTPSEETETPPATETPAPAVKAEPGIHHYAQFSPQSGAYYLPAHDLQEHFRRSSGSYYGQNVGAFYNVGAHAAGAHCFGGPANARLDHSPNGANDLSSNVHYTSEEAGAPHFRANSGEKQDEASLGQPAALVSVKIEDAPADEEAWSPSAYTNDTN